jgi:hypothetical protein
VEVELGLMGWAVGSGPNSVTMGENKDTMAGTDTVMVSGRTWPVVVAAASRFPIRFPD